MKDYFTAILIFLFCLSVSACKKAAQNRTSNIPCYHLSTPEPVLYIVGGDTGTYIYDNLGRLILEQVPNEKTTNSIQYTNDSTLQITLTNRNVSTYGTVAIAMLNSLGFSLSYSILESDYQKQCTSQFDSSGKLIAQYINVSTEPVNVSSSNDTIINIIYDNLGNIISAYEKYNGSDYQTGPK